MKRKITRFIIFILLASLALSLYLGNTRLVTDKFTITVDGLPQSLSGLSIVHLSDLHGAVYGEDNSDLFTAVSDCEPDLIAITGDIIDSGSEDTESDEAYVSQLIEGLCRIAPVYYVTGNHEWASGWVYDLLKLIEQSGAVVLRNGYALISSGDESIVLAGVDDPNGPYDMKTPAELMEEIRVEQGEKPVIVLTHRNDKLSMWSQLGADVVLCGHAHGGLVRLPFTDGLVAPGRKLFPEHTSGIYTQGDTQMFVSRGAGNGKGTLRLFNTPQAAHLILMAE